MCSVPLLTDVLLRFSALKEPTESIERKLQARNETLARINTGDKRGRKILYSTALDMQEQEEIKIKEAERFS